MKKLIIWLAKKFDVKIEVEKVIYKDKIVEKQIALGGVIDGDVTVKGSLIVEGSLEGKNIATYK